MMNGYGGAMGGMWLWWIVGFAILAVLVWAIARTAGTSGPERGDDSPEAILKRRYARGEIDRNEYEHKLNDLRK